MTSARFPEIETAATSERELSRKRGTRTSVFMICCVTELTRNARSEGPRMLSTSYRAEPPATLAVEKFQPFTAASMTERLAGVFAQAAHSRVT